MREAKRPPLKPKLVSEGLSCDHGAAPAQSPEDEPDCDPECLRFRFPAMLLQPLVENAITHGIEPACAGGTIRVSVRCLGDKLVVSVDDTGIGLGNGHTAGTGAGIQNIRARLHSLFGGSARFILESGTPCGTHAGIEVPLSLLSRPAA